MEQRAVRFPRPAERGEVDTVKLRSYLAAAAMKLGLPADIAAGLPHMEVNGFQECSVDREGYPEIGLYWEKAAYEEAEHAAKFAEMLGEDLEPNMKATTKDNLKWRVDCEFGATQGKFDLAKCAKQNNLDAIHDTVHEMAKDEARHGKALKGLLERYFK